MKIIIGTDGSDFSRAAIERCCNLITNPAETKIKVVSVYEEPAPMLAEPFAISAEYYAQIQDVSRNQAKEQVKEAVEQIRARFPDIDVTEQTMMGLPGRMIVEAAQEWGADLIIVGSHGYGFWSRMMLGSTSDSVVHHAPCSVLVVRRAEKLNGNNN